MIKKSRIDFKEMQEMEKKLPFFGICGMTEYIHRTKKVYMVPDDRFCCSRKMIRSCEKQNRSAALQFKIKVIYFYYQNLSESSPACKLRTV